MLRCLVFGLLALGCSRPRAAPDAAAPRPAPRDVVAPRASAPVDAGVAVALDVPPAGPRRVAITLGGDLLVTAPVLRQLESNRLNGRLVALLGPVAPLLAFDTIAFANLRAALGRGGAVPGAPVELSRDLARIGFDVMQVANDRIGDRGAAGLRETLDALRGANVLPVGLNDGDDGPFAPVIVERGGVRVAFLGATTRLLRDPGPAGEHEPRVARIHDDPTPLLGAVTAARSVAELVVVGVSWARDRDAPVSDSQRLLAARLVEAGADLVVGFGQPNLGPVARLRSARGEALVAYSLGTLLSHFGQAWHPGVSRAQVTSNPWVYDPRYRDGVMLHVFFELGDGGSVRVARAAANAVWASHADGQLRVIPMRGVDERVAGERLSAIRAALGGDVRVRP